MRNLLLKRTVQSFPYTKDHEGALQNPSNQLLWCKDVLPEQLSLQKTNSVGSPIQKIAIITKKHNIDEFMCLFADMKRNLFFLTSFSEERNGLKCVNFPHVNRDFQRWGGSGFECKLSGLSACQPQNSISSVVFEIGWPQMAVNVKFYWKERNKTTCNTERETVGLLCVQ